MGQEMRKRNQSSIQCIHPKATQNNCRCDSVDTEALKQGQASPGNMNEC